MLPKDVSIEQAGSLATVRVRRRDLTLAAMQEIAVECLERLRYNNARHFIFDLEGVKFLASACLGEMVSLLREVEHCCGRIALAGCGDHVAFVFKVTRLDAVFGLFDDVEAAAESF